MEDSPKKIVKIAVDSDGKTYTAKRPHLSALNAVNVVIFARFALNSVVNCFTPFTAFNAKICNCHIFSPCLSNFFLLAISGVETSTRDMRRDKQQKFSMSASRYS